MFFLRSICPLHFLDFRASMHIISLSVYQNNYDVCEGDRSDNFVIGLTNVAPNVTPPTLWNYAVCGQYPGVLSQLQLPCSVPVRHVSITCTTPVSFVLYLQCTCGLPVYIRYLIVQFPNTGDGYGNNSASWSSTFTVRSFTGSCSYLP